MSITSVKLFFLSSRRRHTRFDCDWSSDVCSSNLCDSTTASEVRPGLALLAWLGGAAAVSPAGAQVPALTVTLQSEMPRIQTTALLGDGRFVSLMRSGFPLRLHYRLELWRGRPRRVGPILHPMA